MREGVQVEGVRRLAAALLDVPCVDSTIYDDTALVATAVCRLCDARVLDVLTDFILNELGRLEGGLGALPQNIIEEMERLRSYTRNT